MSKDLTVQQPGELAQPVQSDAQALNQFIVKASMDPNFDVAKLTQMLEVRKSLAEIAFNEALARIQPRIPRIKKKREIKVKGTLRSKFAAYEDIFREIGPILDEEHFSVSYTSERPDKDSIKVTCWLKHAMGHKEGSTLQLPFDKSEYRSDVQSWGSTLQYGKRVTLCMALNIVTEDEDDDGQASGQLDSIRRKKIEAMLDDIGDVARTSAFLKFMGAKSVSDIFVSDYEKAVIALNAELKKKTTAKPATDGPPADLPDLKEWPEVLGSQDWVRVQGKLYRWSEERGSYVEAK